MAVKIYLMVVKDRIALEASLVGTQTVKEERLEEEQRRWEEWGSSVVALVEAQVLMLAEGAMGNTMGVWRSPRRNLEQQLQDKMDQALVVACTVEKKDSMAHTSLVGIGLEVEGRIAQNYRNHYMKWNDRETAHEGNRTAAEEQAEERGGIETLVAV